MAKQNRVHGAILHLTSAESVLFVIIIPPERVWCVLSLQFNRGLPFHLNRALTCTTLRCAIGPFTRIPISGLPDLVMDESLKNKKKARSVQRRVRKMLRKNEAVKVKEKAVKIKEDVAEVNEYVKAKR